MNEVYKLNEITFTKKAIEKLEKASIEEGNPFAIRIGIKGRTVVKGFNIY